MSVPGKHALDDRLIVLLAGGQSAEQAAREIGVSARTVHRRLEEPVFRAKVDGLRAQAYESAAASLLSATGGAIRTLIELSDHGKSEHVRQNAARSILEFADVMFSQTTVERRIRALEEASAPTNLRRIG